MDYATKPVEGLEKEITDSVGSNFCTSRFHGFRWCLFFYLILNKILMFNSVKY